MVISMELNRMNQNSFFSLSDRFSKNKVKFHDGQLITGRILRFLPEGNALLKIGQQTLTAQLETTVKALDQYWFQVIMSNNRLKLKVLNNENQKNKPLSEQILLFHRLEPSNEAIKLVKKLMKENIPFTKTQLSDAVIWLQESSKLKNFYSLDMKMEVLSFLIKQKWPLTKEIVHSLLTVYRKETISEDFSILLKWLNSQENLSPTLSQLKNVLNQLYKLSLSLHDDNNFQQTNEDVHKGIFQFQSEETTIKSQLNLSTINLDLILPNDVKIMLKQMMTLLGLSYEQLLKNGEKSQIEEMIKHSLKPLLISATDEVSDANIKEQIQTIINRLNAQALLSSQLGPVDHFFLQWPLQIRQLLTDFSLSIYGKKKQSGEIDPNFCRIVFDLNLPNVEEIIVDILIQNKIMKVTIFNDIVTNEDVNRFIDELRERLDYLNFYLSSISVKSINREKHEKNIKDMLEHTSYQKVDFKI